VNHASNVIGTVQDLAAIGRIARRHGCLFIIDSCQSAGVVPIDFDALAIDILAFTGHKGLFGPMGTGGLLVRSGVEVRPSRHGGTGVDSQSSRQPEQYPYHLEAGTLALPAIAGLNAAQRWFAALGREQVQDVTGELSHGEACRIAQEHIGRVEMRHVLRLERALRAMDGVVVYGPERPDRRVATFSINVDGMPADQVGAILDADYHVCVRTGLHCAPLAHEDLGTLARNGTIRLAPGYFTEEGDVDHLLGALAEIADPAHRSELQS
jgi:selenocysteine lyase/cysteine desulfurase